MKVFVTGITGNVGSVVLRRLLQVPDSEVWALMRGKDQAELQQRLERLFALWKIDAAECRALLPRVHLLRGDMADARFGLDDAAWRSLVTHCDHLVHAAGVVRMNLPLESARQQAVGSARNMIALADAIADSGRDVPLAFVSTVGVAGKQREPLLADWVTGARSFHNSYEQAKAEAEELLRTWRRRPGIRLTVHRPSMVVGASDGEVLRHQVFYYLCEFLSGRHTRGLQPALSQAKLDTIPVDYVADAVCWALQQPDCDGRVFNLCSGTRFEIPLQTVQAWTRTAIAQHGKSSLPRIVTLPSALFRRLVSLATLMLPQPAKRRLAALPVLLDYLQSPQAFDGESTREFLQQQAGLRFPPADSYLPGIIQSFYR